MRGVCGVNGDAAKRRVADRSAVQTAIKPTVRGALDSRRADLHVILGVEMGAGVIRRTGRMNDGQLSLIVNILELRERRMERIKTIEIDGAFFTRGRFGDRDAWPKRIVSAVFERNDCIQSVHAAALENHHQDFPVSGLLCPGGADKKRRRQAEGQETQPGGFDKSPARPIHDYLRWNSGAARSKASASEPVVSASAARVAVESESGAIEPNESLVIAQRIGSERARRRADWRPDRRQSSCA